MGNVSTLATVASVIAGFGVAMLFFRLQRELAMHDQMEPEWIPWADRMLIAATLTALLLVLLPLVAMPSGRQSGLPAAACAAAVCLLAGYVISILAHYRLILGGGRTGPRSNPEPAEKWLVLGSTAVAVAVFLFILIRQRLPEPQL